MLAITNAQPESIKVIYSGGSVIIPGQETFKIPLAQDENIIKIAHTDFLGRADSGVDRLMGSVVKSAALIVDSTYCVTQIGESASLLIDNETYEHGAFDFGYLFFNVRSNNCKCTLQGCNGVNSKEVLRLQKLMCLDDGSDFPPFSAVGALMKYRKIKKLCCDSEVFKFLKSTESTGGR